MGFELLEAGLETRVGVFFFFEDGVPALVFMVDVFFLFIFFLFLFIIFLLGMGVAVAGYA